MSDHMPTLGLARLTPPPGGERRLRESLDARTADAHGWRPRLALAGAGLCALLLAFVLRTDPMNAEIRQAINAAVASSAEVRIADARAERVATRNANVRIYRFAGEPDAR